MVTFVSCVAFLYIFNDHASSAPCKYGVFFVAGKGKERKGTLFKCLFILAMER